MKCLKNDQNGMTITELMVVLPLATIVLVSLISILFSQYGSILAESKRSNLRSTGQSLLTKLQDELLFTIEYGHDLQEDLVDPNEPSGGWTYDTTPQTLIISEAALDSTRPDEDRKLIRKIVNPCLSSAITDNPVAINNIIYFTEPNPDSQYLRLYKRTIIPTYPVCSEDRSTGSPCIPSPPSTNCRTFAKELTCPESAVGSNGCTKKDILLSENIIDFQVRYYEIDNIETPYPSDAEKIEVELTLGDLVFGRNVQVEVNHTIRKIN